MAKQRDVPGFKPHDSPAGGWGALRATANAVREQMEIAEAPLLLYRTNKPGGFDCPGCAWPDKEHTSTFQFCENGAKAVTWEATRKRVPPEFFAAHTVAELLGWSDFELENEGRLTHPLKYDAASDTYRAVSWESAFARIGESLRALPDPNMVEFYTSGRASNEAAFLFQLFAREYGTNNFPDCSNMCHEATSVGLPQSIGIGKGTVSLDDFERCDLIISIGHNPGTNHPRMMGTLHDAARRGVPIIVFNPLRERALERFADPQSAREMATLGSTPIATTYLQVKVGGDAAALAGIMKGLLELDEIAAAAESGSRAEARTQAAVEARATGAAAKAAAKSGAGAAAGARAAAGVGAVAATEAKAASGAGTPIAAGVEAGAGAELVAGVLDREFIAAHTRGFETLAAQLRATSWEEIELGSGLAATELRAVAALYAESQATIVSYGMGVTQHTRGTATVQQIANLLLLRGNIGKPGAGICPLRGHSNVQGDRTVGITEKPNAALLEGIERTFHFKPPAAHGHDAVAAMQAIIDGRSTALIALGGNLAVALPDPGRCFEAMRRLPLAVHIATKLNRSHLLIGREAFLLPCLGRTEADLQAGGPQSITVEDSMSMVHASTGKLEPASPELRSEPAIVAGMAAAVLTRSRVPWLDLVADYDRIRDAIESVFPDFKNFNERIRVPGGFRLPLAATLRVWNTDSSKAQFMPVPVLQDQAAPRDASAGDASLLRMTTIRSHDQYNTTIYGMDDRYRGIFGRRDVVFVNAADLEANGLEHGDAIDVETALNYPSGESRRLTGYTAIAYDIARGSVAAYYPEANCLVPLEHHDPQSGTPSYKSIPVRIRKSTAARPR
jgi:molybdopterin-dependent oxidoreductase alpha subunit